MVKKLFALFLLILFHANTVTLLFSQDTQKPQPDSTEVQTITLPAPQLDRNNRLMQALKQRHSNRSFSTKELPLNILSNLLWAAKGINRSDSKGLTVPSAHNWQEIDVYVAKKEALYIYDPQSHALNLVFAKDIRKDAGIQQFTQIAPVNLIYVADFNKMSNASNEEKIFYSAADTGFISQNVYLYCASENIATVVLGWIDKPKLEQTMRLPENKKVILTQPVGLPKK